MDPYNADLKVGATAGQTKIPNHKSKIAKVGATRIRRLRRLARWGARRRNREMKLEKRKAVGDGDIAATARRYENSAFKLSV